MTVQDQVKQLGQKFGWEVVSDKTSVSDLQIYTRGDRRVTVFWSTEALIYDSFVYDKDDEGQPMFRARIAGARKRERVQEVLMRDPETEREFD